MASSDSRPDRPLPTALAERPGLVRRLVRPALVLITLVLVADSLIGDKGLLEHRRESRRHADIERDLEQHRHDNHTLRIRARRLREQDPATIEDLARRRLGMIKPGELLFVVTDAEGRAPAAAPPKR